jgi:RimJ/RimL family protein N-acetyltransferase
LATFAAARFARMLVRLATVSPDLREALLRLAPQPEQERFAGRLTETLPAAEADPERMPVAILADDEPAGFFVLHRGPAAGVLAPERRDVLLRAFLVDAGFQGRGIATAALGVLPGFVAQRLPGIRRIVLSVNVRNPVAIRTYLRAGFADTGALYHGGMAGPQHVFELWL